jgi:hypothetical protein
LLVVVVAVHLFRVAVVLVVLEQLVDLVLLEILYIPLLLVAVVLFQQMEVILFFPQLLQPVAVVVQHTKRMVLPAVQVVVQVEQAEHLLEHFLVVAQVLQAKEMLVEILQIQ